MKKLTLFATYLLLFLPFCYAQAEYYGYYEGQYATTKNYQNGYHKLRVDLETSSDKFQFKTNFNVVNYFGKTGFVYGDIIPVELTEYEKNIPFTYFDTLYLDNLFAKHYLKSLDITLGKQQLSFGSGYAFNPTDIFNKKEISDPQYEQAGVNAIRADIPLGEQSISTFVYSYDEDFDKSTKMVSLKRNIDRFDVELFFGDKQLSRGKREVFGFSTVGQVFDFGVFNETAFNNTKEDFWEITTGIDYTFDGGLFLLAEWFFASYGTSGDYTKTEWISYLASDTKSLTKHQIFVLGNYPIADLITLESSFALAPADPSVALFPAVNYSFSENIDILLKASASFGKTNSQYSGSFDKTLFLQTKLYF